MSGVTCEQLALLRLAGQRQAPPASIEDPQRRRANSNPGAKEGDPLLQVEVEDSVQQLATSRFRSINADGQGEIVRSPTPCLESPSHRATPFSSLRTSSPFPEVPLRRRSVSVSPDASPQEAPILAPRPLRGRSLSVSPDGVASFQGLNAVSNKRFAWLRSFLPF